MSPNPTNPAPRKRLPIATWHIRPTTDHAGAGARTVWFGTSTSPPTATSFQLCTTFPAPADPAAAQAAALSHARLVVGGAGFLSQHSDASPRFDVYEGLPDVLACVEHQRGEIRARRGAVGGVPRFAASAYERPRGLVVVLTGEVDGGKVKREGPVFVWIERDAEWGKVRVPWDLEGEEGGEMALERIEVLAVRVWPWGSVEGEMMKVRMERDEEGEERKGEETEEDKRDDEREEKSQETTSPTSSAIFLPLPLPYWGSTAHPPSPPASNTSATSRWHAQISASSTSSTLSMTIWDCISIIASSRLVRRSRRVLTGSAPRLREPERSSRGFARFLLRWRVGIGSVRMLCCS